MINFPVNSHRFQLRAGAIVLEAGYVLLHRFQGDTFWALPGGRVEAGEAAAQTIVREFMEELALSVTCNELISTGENFFEYEGVQYHELGLYFAVTLPKDAVIRDTEKLHIGVEGERKLEFKWFACEALRDVDFRPAALREGLIRRKVASHFVQRA